MGLFYLLAVFVAVVGVSAAEMVMVSGTTYANVMLNGKVHISKSMNISQDENVIEFSPEHIMNVNDSNYKFNDIDISDMNFTLTASAAATEQVASNRVVAVMNGVNGGTLTMHVDVFTAAGNVTIDGEVTMVAIGDIRITLLVSGAYNFNADSTMLKLTFDVERDDKDPKMKNDDAMTDGKTYELGKDGMLRLSQKGKVGNNYVDMMPMVKKEEVTISFNKSDTQSDSYMYQFFITPAEADLSTSASTRVTSLSVFALILTSLTFWLS